ncbi:MAG: methylated-DNA--[protein]-cysteine S-methyltransferase [Planctomycetota bacterium]
MERRTPLTAALGDRKRKGLTLEPTFGASVLTKCRQLQFGQTISYAGLAKKSSRPAASRAVGGALARNPLPLIIPCHRVLRNDGGLSAPGGIAVKKKMLDLNRRGLSFGKMSDYV